MKIKIGSSFRGLLKYQSERACGIDGIKTGQPLCTNMVGKTPRALSREISIVRGLRPRLNKAVAHLMICPANPLAAIEEWERALQIAFQEHGINQNETPYVAYLHADGEHPHLHVAFSRIRFDGTVISDSQSFRKNESAARAIENELGLGKLLEVPKEKKPYSRQKSYSALRREKRINTSSKTRGEKSMTDEINEIAAAAEKAMENSSTPAEFKSKIENGDLQGSTVVFSRRGDQNEIYGWSIQLPSGTYLKGSELGRHLSWNRISERLLANSARAKRRERFLRITPVPLEQRTHAENVRPLRPLQAPQPQPQPQRAPGGMPIPSYTCREAESGGRIFEYLDEAGNVVISDELDAEDGFIYLAESATHDENAVERWLALGDSRLGSFSVVEGAGADEEFWTIVSRVAARRNFQITSPAFLVDRILAERDRLAAELRAAAGGTGGQREREVDPLAFLVATPAPVLSQLAQVSVESEPVAAPVFIHDEFVERAAEARRFLVFKPPVWISDSSAARMSVSDLRGAAQELEAFEPVAAWVKSAGVRVEREGHALEHGRVSAGDLVLLQAEERARFAGQPMATERARIASRIANNQLLLARRAKDEAAQAGILGKFRLPGLESNVGRLRLAFEARRDEFFKSRADFDAAHRGDIQAMQSRIDCYLVEKQVLNTFGFVASSGHGERPWLQRAQEQVDKHVVAKEEQERFRAELEVPREVLQEDERDGDQQRDRDRFEVPR